MPTMFPERGGTFAGRSSVCFGNRNRVQKEGRRALRAARSYGPVALTSGRKARRQGSRVAGVWLAARLPGALTQRVGAGARPGRARRPVSQHPRLRRGGRTPGSLTGSQVRRLHRGSGTRKWRGRGGATSPRCRPQSRPAPALGPPPPRPRLRRPPRGPAVSFPGPPLWASPPA